MHARRESVFSSQDQEKRGLSPSARFAEIRPGLVRALFVRTQGQAKLTLPLLSA